MLENLVQASKHRWHKIDPRNRSWLLGIALFAIAALAGWKPLRYESTIFLALRSDSPSGAVLSELVTESSNRPKTLERMWRSGNITVREFVINYLNTRLRTESFLLEQMQAIVNEAAYDSDLDTREPALNVLAKINRPESLDLLRQQLTDVDPAIRVLALQQLQQAANSNDVSAAIRLLDDPDPRVVVSAGSLLRRVTRQDFGLKVTQALPQFRRVEGEPPPPSDRESIRRGVERWHEWWQLHHSEFPESVVMPTRAVQGLPAKEFRLEDLDGRVVQLSDFRGKAVLLCFWNIADPASFDDFDALKRLQEQQARRLAVVGVAFDPAVGPQDEHEEHEHGHEYNRDHAHSPKSPPDPAAARSAVRKLVTRMSVKYPVLVDLKGSVVFRYNVQEVPTYVLIDAQGNLRRRFVGPRELPAWTAMVEEISSHH